MKVELFKRETKYMDKDNVEKTATKFYVECGDALVPVEAVYFPDKQTGKDKGYAGRMAVLKAFAAELPPLPSNKDAHPAPSATEA